MVTQPDTTKWTVHQTAYMEWLATPKKLRNPKTVLLLAQKLGYDRTTLWEWTKYPGWHKAVADIARGYLHGEAPEIFQALSERARGGDVPAIKLALEILGEYTPKSTLDLSGALTVNMNDIANMSDDELDAIAKG